MRCSVPVCIACRIFQAEVCAQVDDFTLRIFREQCGGGRRRFRMRKRQKYSFRTSRNFLRIKCFVHEFRPCEVWKYRSDGFPYRLLGRHSNDAYLWMAQE